VAASTQKEIILPNFLMAQNLVKMKGISSRFSYVAWKSWWS
jgi:hypothetical protein